MTTRLLLLSPNPDLPSRCLHIDGAGRVLASGAPSDDGLAAGATRTVVAVPGIEARALWLELPARSAAQALGAAKVLLDDHIADRRHAPHIALAAPRAGESRLVVAVEPAVMAGWLARLATMGMRADVLLPDHLLLPATEDSRVRVVDVGDRWIVRGRGIAFSAEPDLATRILDGRDLQPLTTADADTLFATAVRTPEINLLQQAFAAPASGTGRGSRTRRIAWLATAAALSPLLIVAGQALRYEIAAGRLEAQSTSLAAAAAPGTAQAGDPAITVRTQLRQAQASQALGEALQALSAAVARSPGTSLDALEYRQGAPLGATLRHATPAQLDAVRATLAGRGWRVDAGRSAASNDGLRTALVLESGA